MSDFSELIYGQLPDDWHSGSIGTLVAAGLADLQTGPFGTALLASEYKDVGIPVLAVKHIGQNRILPDDDMPHVDGETYERLIKYRLEVGDIVFGRKGAVDRRALITKKEYGWLQGSDCIRLRLLTNNVDAKFVSYVLGSPQYISWIIRNAGGSTMPSLNQSILKRVPLPLPPLPEQCTIAHILGTLDDKIELNRQMNATLEAIARAIFKSWFVDFDPVYAKANGEQPYGMDADTDALFPDSFEETEMGWIPAGWKVGTLGEISNKPRYGYTASAHDDIVGPKFLRIADINKSTWITWETVPYCEISDADYEKYQIAEGDILIARMADPGHGVLIDEESRAVFASYLIRFQMLNPLYRRVIQYWLRSTPYWLQVDANKKGTTRASLNAQELSRFELVLPPDPICEVFSVIVAGLRKLVVHNSAQSRTLAELRDTLLPKLVSGELRVGDVKV